jgi:hypothetical protein
LQEAEDNNPRLMYGSDLNYLRGVALLRQGETVMAANAFATFCAFSEAVYSPTFNLHHREPDTLYFRTLMNAQARNDNGFDSAHCAPVNLCARLTAPAYIPGFRFTDTDSFGLIAIGLGYSAENGLLGAADLGLPFSMGLMPYLGGWADKNRTSVHSGCLWRVYRNTTNTFGIEAATTLSLTNYDNLTDAAGTAILPQASFRVESGWIPVSRVSLFAGYLYPVFNQFNKWEDRRHLFWNQTNPYGGVNLHLLGDLGLTGRYENDQLVAGIFLGRLVFGYGSKGMYFNITMW